MCAWCDRGVLARARACGVCSCVQRTQSARDDDVDYKSEEVIINCIV